MNTTTLKRHAHFIVLSGLTLVFTFCIGFLLAQTVDNTNQLPVTNVATNPNSVLFISLRLVFYTGILMAWKRLINLLDRGLPKNNLPTKDYTNALQRLTAHRYKIAVLILLFEVLCVQQGWEGLIQGLTPGLTQGQGG